MVSNHIDISSISLPNEVPPPPQIDAAVLKQAPGTFETLLSQNQELMQRLTIALRQNLDMESRLGKTIERNSYLELQAQAIHSEMSQMSEINRKLEMEFVSLRKQRDHAERIYGEFHTEALERIGKLSDRLARLNRYKRRIKKFVRPLLKTLKGKIQDDKKTFEKTLEENLQYRTQLEQFKKQLSEAYSRIQAQHSENELNQKQIVEKYEAKLNYYIKELDFVKQEHERYQKNHAELESRYQVLLEAQGTFENRAIMAERRYNDFKSSKEQLIHELQEQLAKNSIESQSLKQQLFVSSAEVTKLNQIVTEQKDDLNTLKAQYEGLQTIWNKAALENEDLQQKIQSLQKLNKDISHALSDRRKENEFLQEQLRKNQEKQNEKIQNIYEHLKTYTNDRAKISEEGFIETQSPSNEILSRVEALLNEAQNDAVGKSSMT